VANVLELRGRRARPVVGIAREGSEALLQVPERACVEARADPTAVAQEPLGTIAPRALFHRSVGAEAEGARARLGSLAREPAEHHEVLVALALDLHPVRRAGGPGSVRRAGALGHDPFESF